MVVEVYNEYPRVALEPVRMGINTPQIAGVGNPCITLPMKRQQVVLSATSHNICNALEEGCVEGSEGHHSGPVTRCNTTNYEREHVLPCVRCALLSVCNAWVPLMCANTAASRSGARGSLKHPESLLNQWSSWCNNRNSASKTLLVCNKKVGADRNDFCLHLFCLASGLKRLVAIHP